MKDSLENRKRCRLLRAYPAQFFTHIRSLSKPHLCRANKNKHNMSEWMAMTRRRRKNEKNRCEEVQEGRSKMFRQIVYLSAIEMTATVTSNRDGCLHSSVPSHPLVWAELRALLPYSRHGLPFSLVASHSPPFAKWGIENIMFPSRAYSRFAS